MKLLELFNEKRPKTSFLLLTAAKSLFGELNNRLVSLETNSTKLTKSRFKNLPNPGKFVGQIIVTDVGDPYSVWFSDGLQYKPFAGSLVIEQAHQEDNGVTGASAAGTSDLGFGLSSGNTRFPLGKQFDLLAGLMGNHGTVRVKVKFTATNNATSHEVGLGCGLKYTGSVILASSNEPAWSTKLMEIDISNRGSEINKTVTVCVITSDGINTNTKITSSNITLDTGIDQKLWFYGCLNSGAADIIKLESFTIELLRA